jgi:hypothetical protein
MQKLIKTQNTMQTLTQTQFLQQIAKHLPYTPDSANYALYEGFTNLLISDGGDDTFAHLNHHTVAFEFSKHVTLQHIEQYDNDTEILDIYLNIKPNIKL